MRWFSFLILGFLIAWPLWAGAEEVRIGIDDNPPLTFVDEQGIARGLFPDLFSQIAKETNWSIKYVPCQWQQCLESLATGDIDILPAIAYTEQRASKYNFAKETVVSSWGQVYHRSDNSFSSILDLAGKKLAVLNKDVYLVGDQGLLQVADKFDVKIDYVEVSSYREAFTLLKNGKVDAAMVGRIYGIKHHCEFDLLPSSIMVKPIQVRPAFSPAAPKRLAVEFDQLFQNWKQSPDSVYYQLLNKWLSERHSPVLSNLIKIIMYSLTTIFAFSLVATFWHRRQVMIKTRQLAEKNKLLKYELQERERVEQELLESQQQYRIFFEESFSTMLLVDPDSARIVDANPAACEFYKYSKEQLEKMKMWQINQLGEQETHRRLDIAKKLDHHQSECIHTLGDGRKVPVEVFRSPIRVNGKTLFYSIIHDISKRKRAEYALEERNQFLQSVIDGVSDPLMVIDLDYTIIQMNESAKKMQSNGYANRDNLTCYGHSHNLLHPCSGKNHPCPLREVIATERPATMIHQHQSERGKRIVELTASPLFDSMGKLYAIIEVARDITERLQIEGLLSENEKRLHHLAHHDSLTDLPNRLLLEDRLEHAITKARRSHKQVALLFLDLDYLKAVNDNLGHDFGDQLLIDVANRLRKCIREGDTVAR
ncbi:MAG: diguanylate cyclase, partial [Desulfuromonadales bacterium]|nr:diguanylate cyclase [Desulfuromonadales bacterium]